MENSAPWFLTESKKMMYRNDKKEYFLKKAEKYVNQKKGELTIKSIIGMKKYNGAYQTFVKCECSCGKIVEAPLTQILAGQWTSCGHTKNENLKKSKEAHVEGTFIYAIDGRKHIQKNNSTGFTGVSKRGKKYRAYINFKKKQYHLGYFEDIEDAIEARKTAEKEIHGSFLEWYAQNYPEEWEKIKTNKSCKK